MNKLLIALAIMVTPFAYAANDAGADAGTAKPTLAILPLSGQFNWMAGNQSDSVYQRVTDAFMKIKHFDVMERAQLGSILEEGKFQNSGVADENTAISLGKQAGAKEVVLGTYRTVESQSNTSWQDKKGMYHNDVSFHSKIDVNLRLVDVQTGKIQNTFTIQGAGSGMDQAHDYDDLMSDLSKKLEREISNAFPVGGYVIKVLGDNKYLLDLGKSSGVAQGDEFSIVEHGEDIVHPVTGKVIKGATTVIADAEVESVDDDTSIIEVSNAKKDIAVGMSIEAKPKKKGFFESLRDITK